MESMVPIQGIQGLTKLSLNSILAWEFHSGMSCGTNESCLFGGWCGFCTFTTKLCSKTRFSPRLSFFKGGLYESILSTWGLGHRCMISQSNHTPGDWPLFCFLTKFTITKFKKTMYKTLRLLTELIEKASEFILGSLSYTSKKKPMPLWLLAHSCQFLLFLVQLPKHCPYFLHQRNNPLNFQQLCLQSYFRGDEASNML